MKSRTFLFILVLAATSFGASVGFSMPHLQRVEDSIILREIAHVETGNNPNAPVGSRGERTQYQFLPSTWRQYSKVPFATAARNQTEVNRVARAHISFIRARLKARGISDTPYNIAAAWNAGANRVRIPASTCDYAQRVHNLVEVALRAQSPKPEPVVATAAQVALNPGALSFSVTVPDEPVPTISFPVAARTSIPRIHINEEHQHPIEVYFVRPLFALVSY